MATFTGSPECLMNNDYEIGRIAVWDRGSVLLVDIRYDEPFDPKEHCIAWYSSETMEDGVWKNGAGDSRFDLHPAPQFNRKTAVGEMQYRASRFLDFSNREWDD